MPFLVRAAAAICVLWALLAGADAAPRGSATLYIFHPLGLLSNPISPDVVVNGRDVGGIKAGTYVVVPVRAGATTFHVRAGLIDLGRDTSLRVAAGGSYYIGVGITPSGAIGMRGLVGLLWGSPGTKPMAGSSAWSGYSLFVLDANEGRAAIARLRRAR